MVFSSLVYNLGSSSHPSFVFATFHPRASFLLSHLSSASAAATATPAPPTEPPPPPRDAATATCCARKSSGSPGPDCWRRARFLPGQHPPKALSRAPPRLRSLVWGLPPPLSPAPATRLRSLVWGLRHLLHLRHGRTPGHLKCLPWPRHPNAAAHTSGLLPDSGTGHFPGAAGYASNSDPCSGVAIGIVVIVLREIVVSTLLILISLFPQPQPQPP